MITSIKSFKKLNTKIHVVSVTVNIMHKTNIMIIEHKAIFVQIKKSKYECHTGQTTIC